MPARVFLDLLQVRAGARARPFVDGLNGLFHPRTAGREAFAALFAETARLLGRAPVTLGEDERARLRAAAAEWGAADVTLDELGRIGLLLTAAGHLLPPELEALVATVYDEGDSRERRAVLRALPLLPEPERFVERAVAACRTSVVPVFEAIACENPYPARHFPDGSFNQMVLKVLFQGLRLERVVGLARRCSPELARMGEDLARERRAAGRPVPEDLCRITGRTS